MIETVTLAAGHAPEKGFLPLTDELQWFSRPTLRPGVTSVSINWDARLMNAEALTVWFVHRRGQKSRITEEADFSGVPQKNGLGCQPDTTSSCPVEYRREIVDDWANIRPAWRRQKLKTSITLASKLWIYPTLEASPMRRVKQGLIYLLNLL